ncbi:RNA polymerase sigma factor SigJ [Serratia marcescens]|uniref:RNA polymerase sigma factor SigJ n=1 Tax=Serratia TaxID=613 RepID=UPI0006686D6A|nr:RNA polymerase sigma factor SigJ [Serratia marcescens]EMB2733496.1 RNA polymerase sigma factor SigJ [Serratia marcescens]MBH2624809.1 RNA polymerase sigma factor SigJ [Serratia marcescens]MBH2823863.1 RNA polymerase sigma factor SigJ [Serratia marcescens]MBH3303813.1 RNA polymerase sigma factor SigJ [Serratia marcescens]
MKNDKYAALFESRRAFLIGLAYRILGSLADAEDAVQDTYIKWLHADRHSILNPAAWLTTVCTRRCLDLLRAAQQARVDYVGIWLPEPIQTAAAKTPEQTLELSSSLSTAFMLLLERLTPRERAAYLLHDIFDLPYADLAMTLGGEETACRKLVSRAREKVGRPEERNTQPTERQEALLIAFKTAVETADIEPLSTLLSEDVKLSADGGGKVPANLAELVGKRDVLEFIGGKLPVFWRAYLWQHALINGVPGALLSEQGRITASVSLSLNAEGRLAQVFIVRNPSKLSQLDRLWTMPLR